MIDSISSFFSSNDGLHISLKVTEMSSFAIFRNFVAMEQGPEDLVSSSAPIISLISFGVVGAIKNESSILFFRYMVGFLGFLGISSSKLGPALVKNSLNVFAIPLLEVVCLSFYTSGEICDPVLLFIYIISLIHFHVFFILLKFSRKYCWQ